MRKSLSIIFLILIRYSLTHAVYLSIYSMLIPTRRSIYLACPGELPGPGGKTEVRHPQCIHFQCLYRPDAQSSQLLSIYLSIYLAFVTDFFQFSPIMMFLFSSIHFQCLYQSDAQSSLIMLSIYLASFFFDFATFLLETCSLPFQSVFLCWYGNLSVCLSAGLSVCLSASLSGGTFPSLSFEAFFQSFMFASFF